MSDTERMTIDERYKYLRGMQKRYGKGGRAERSRLLDEMEQVTGLHRKSLVRLMGGEIGRKVRERQRGKRYGRAMKEAVRVIAESLDWVCAERLRPNLVWLAEHLERHGELALSAEVHGQLATVSVSTLRRLLADMPRERPRLPIQHLVQPFLKLLHHLRFELFSRFLHPGTLLSLRIPLFYPLFTPNPERTLSLMCAGLMRSSVLR